MEVSSLEDAVLGFPRRSGNRFGGWHKPTCMVKSSRKGDGVSILSLSHHLSGCQVILTWKLGSIWHHTRSCWFSRKVMRGNSPQHSQGQVWVMASYSWGQSLTDHLSVWLQAGYNPDCTTQPVAAILSPRGVWMGRSFAIKVCAERRAGPRGWEGKCRNKGCSSEKETESSRWSFPLTLHLNTQIFWKTSSEKLKWAWNVKPFNW